MFLVFEGIDGSGKTTQAKLLADHLKEKRGIEALLVREPGGTRLGEKLRDLVLDPSSEEIHTATEIFLFMAARSHLVRTRILPALEARRVVISDRFLWSTVVYQGIAAGVAPREIFRMGRLAAPGIRVRKTFVIDMDPEVAFERVKAKNRMEHRGVEFQVRVRDAFLSLAETFHRRAAVIDGRGTPEEVHARVIAQLPTNGWSRCSCR
jgi:dTMP kinase